MKRFYSLFTCLVLIFGSAASLVAQGIVTEQDPNRMERGNFTVTNQQIRVGQPTQPTAFNGTRANTSFTMDYDVTSGNDAAFIWWLNDGYTAGGDLNYALVTYDSLITQDSVAYDYDLHTVLVDSIDVIVSHRNSSGMEDTLVVSMVELDATGFPTTSVLWSDSLFTNTSLTSSRFSAGTVTFYPNLAICNARFGVRVAFYGPTSDTLGVIAGFREGAFCAAANCGAEGLGAVPLSSYMQYNTASGPTEIPTAGGGSLYYDCNQSGGFDADSCEWFVIQDFWFTASVSISDAPAPTPTATIMTTPDNGSGNGTAWVEVTGTLGAVDLQWNNQATTDTITGLSAGPVSIFVQYGNNCGIATASGTVESNVSIEDELNAGIAQLSTFPNPTEDQIAIQIELNQVDDLRIRLYDLSGKAVFQDQQQNVQSYNRSISLGDMAAGVYLLQVETSRGRASKRVVVL